MRVGGRFGRLAGTAVTVATCALVLTPASRASVVVARFVTSLGNIDVQLLAGNAPKTVQNFLAYVPGSGAATSYGSYDGTFLHRLIPGFVLQGGGYALNSANQASPISSGPEIQSEASTSIPNDTGTLAMALSSGPNSATDQWFFNLANNKQLNDTSDGGPFTVFGKVLDPAGMNVLHELASLPTSDLTPELTPGQSDNCQTTSPTSPFCNVPVINYSSGASLTNNNLAVISSISILPTIAPTITVTSPMSGQAFIQGQSVTPAYSCDDGDGTGVASCTGPATVDTSQLGEGAYTVTATDYAGDTTQQTVNYQVVPASLVATSTDWNPPPPTSDSGSGTGKPSPPPVPRLVHTTVRATGATVPITLSCPAKTTCLGTLELTLAGAKLTAARGSYRLRAGQRRTFELKLTPAARRQLHGRRGTVAASLRLLPRGARTATDKRLKLSV
jgi:cyclophilin family peptidyl-prolyl cis-trans isomerase